MPQPTSVLCVFYYVIVCWQSVSSMEGARGCKQTLNNKKEKRRSKSEQRDMRVKQKSVHYITTSELRVHVFFGLLLCVSVLQRMNNKCT